MYVRVLVNKSGVHFIQMGILLCSRWCLAFEWVYSVANGMPNENSIMQCYEINEFTMQIFAFDPFDSFEFQKKNFWEIISFTILRYSIWEFINIFGWWKQVSNARRALNILELHYVIKNYYLLHFHFQQRVLLVLMRNWWNELIFDREKYFLSLIEMLKWFQTVRMNARRVEDSYK